MKFYSLRDAQYYLRSHTKDFQAKLKIVKTRHWSMDEWGWKPCWTVVMK